MMEEKKIIVVIDTKNDIKNIIRTMNCIRRQTAYEYILPVILYDESMNVEENIEKETSFSKEIDNEISDILRKTTVAADLEDLKKIIKDINIKETFFINTQIVLEPNAIETLINEKTDEQCILKYMIADLNGAYRTNNLVSFSPYCKIYNSRELLNLFNEGNKIDKVLQLKYMLNKRSSRLVDAYSYQIGNLGLCVDYDIDYEFIKLLTYNEDFLGIDLVTDIVEQTLCTAFEDSIELESNQAYSFLQKSLETLTFDENILALECKRYGIAPELFKIIGRCNIIQFKNMYKKFKKLQVNSKLKLVNSIDVRQDGYEVAQYVVNMYQEGKLGMGTIIKSVIAWIKYKFTK